MPNSYALGDKVRLYGAFRNILDVLADPATITVYVRQEAEAVVQTFTYAAAEVVKDNVGLYHLDFTSTRSGRLFHRWVGTGVDTVAETYVNVLPSNVANG